jgi:hypothetical protein
MLYNRNDPERNKLAQWCNVKKFWFKTDWKDFVQSTGSDRGKYIEGRGWVAYGTLTKEFPGKYDLHGPRKKYRKKSGRRRRRTWCLGQSNKSNLKLSVRGVNGREDRFIKAGGIVNVSKIACLKG